MVRRLWSILPFCHRHPSFGRGVRDPQRHGAKTLPQAAGRCAGRCAGSLPVPGAAADASPGRRITGMGREEDQGRKTDKKGGKGSGSVMESPLRQKAPAPAAPGPPQARRMTPSPPAMGRARSPASPRPSRITSSGLVPRQSLDCGVYTAEDRNARGGRGGGGGGPPGSPQRCNGLGHESKDCKKQQGPGSATAASSAGKNKDTSVTQSVSPACAQERLSCLVPLQGTVPPSYFFPGRIPRAS